jgi:hypothetical protein
MRRSSRAAGIGLMAALALASLSAQSERLSLKIVPAPDQAIRIDNHQEIRVNAVGGATPLAIAMDITTRMLMKSGPRNAEGTMTVRVAFEDATVTATLNGSPMPVPKQNVSGNSVVLEYARDNIPRIVETTGAIDAGSARTMIDGFSAMLPADASLAVGETLDVPVNLPLPLPGVRGGALAGTLHLSLTSIEQDGDARIARLAQTIETTVNGQGADTAMKISMSGGGTMIWDVTHGVQREQDANINLDLGSLMPGAPPVKGTLKMTWRGTRIEGQ